MDSKRPLNGIYKKDFYPAQLDSRKSRSKSYGAKEIAFIRTGSTNSLMYLKIQTPALLGLNAGVCHFIGGYSTSLRAVSY
jgi:hypothetical protein